ncbi:hypothetical protein G7Y89_g1164 [Cudoniella acicularis]|uniref:Uncharacterized protein n=1 Tax=Cudoniella acicularis TaxID=354080 RepID=A0A8H4RWX9_9HELO|nr:hypothetical protein G7Y89_g1164 [Cudoniella acicularis]
MFSDEAKPLLNKKQSQIHDTRRLRTSASSTNSQYAEPFTPSAPRYSHYLARCVPPMARHPHGITQSFTSADLEDDGEEEDDLGFSCLKRVRSNFVFTGTKEEEEEQN